MGSHRTLKRRTQRVKAKERKAERERYLANRTPAEIKRDELWEDMNKRIRDMYLASIVRSFERDTALFKLFNGK
jgi:hypothetical protein